MLMVPVLRRIWWYKSSRTRIRSDDGVGSLRSVALHQRLPESGRRLPRVAPTKKPKLLAEHSAASGCPHVSRLTTSAYHWYSVAIESKVAPRRIDWSQSCDPKQEMDSVAAWQFGWTPALKGPLQFRTHYTGWHQTPLYIQSIYFFLFHYSLDEEFN